MRIAGLCIAILLCGPLFSQATPQKTMTLNCTLESSGEATFCVQSAKAGSLVVEYSLWGRWIKFDTVCSLTAGQDTCVSATYQLHHGQNQLRFFVDDGVPATYDVTSSSAKYTVTDSTYRCGNIGPQGGGTIQLSRSTYWEIHTEKGSMVKRGNSSTINKSGLAAGKYKLYYENCSMEFVVL
jgi:hypothetical protein